MFRWYRIRPHERGLFYRDRVFQRVLRPGRHWVFDPLFRVRVERVSTRDPWLTNLDLDVIARSGELGDEARVLELGDRERALVWIDGRFDGVFGPGLFALWTCFCRVSVEIVEIAADGLFEDARLAQILGTASGAAQLEPLFVDQDQVSLVYVDGRLARTLSAGRYAYWRGVARIALRPVDLREQALDVVGQDIMTADKVTLRLNAVLTYRVTEPERAATCTESFEQALYRETQLALRAVVGGGELDALLGDREAVAAELRELVQARATDLGVEVGQLGIRDVILPGEMRTLLNRVTEARKAAEANQIARREETAAMRSQANTARLLEASPTLMRLRELEVLEKVSERANLTVVLGEGGLADRVVKLL